MRRLILLALLAAVAAFIPSSAALARPAAHAAVIGGTTAAPGTWPSAAFIVAMQGNDGYACTGTVIAPRVVLTAAHCATDPTGADYRVVTGTQDWNDPSTRQVSDVSQLATFPSWDPTDRFGDAAVLILSKPTTAPAMQVATLNDVALLRAGHSVSFAGWGQTFTNDQNPPSALRTATVQLETPSYCGESSAQLHGRYEPAAMLCSVDSVNFAAGPCHGDSGGPLVATRADGTVVEVGIASAAEEECTTRFPGLWTRADLVSAWVNAWVNAVASSAGASVVPTPTVPAGSNATPPVGELSNGEIAGDLRRAISTKMGAAFRGAKGYRSRCARQSASSVKCNVSWKRQGRAYTGVVTVFLRYDRVQRLVVVASTAKFKTKR